ncbi:opt oligopeptide transporter [Moniliophthora roreri MCA 2997]|uniref:Opt oligopeptide transporter n=1 Tax=Moniliophthora roreri (strain MCA 2997) TaxID=1381753 RepID=V2WHZ1_MONRO|nr:opt oligopeptide transporter [Moniliophthora roreri MCA 2997]
MAAKAATAFHDTLFNENSARDSPSQSFNSEKDDLEKTQVPVAQPLDEILDLDDPNLNTEDLVDIEEESPYPEVRSAVANADDVDMPCSTLRAWVIGLAFAILIPGLNQFFFFRFPSVTITAIVGQLISFPIGRFAAATLPRKKIFGISLNPGPFNVKEHVLVTVMASVGYQSAYATDIIAVQRVYYNQIYNFDYQWFVVMSTQMIGFSIGGIARRFLVSPPSMIWPRNLVNCTLFNTLHHQQYAGVGERGGISRERFFVYTFLGSFLWYFFPGYIFPDNTVIAQLFGYQHGLGMSILTFDWNQITYITSPLSTPWWAEANVFAGFIIFFWILTPILYFTNTWYAKFMPISSRISYDNTGNVYNVTRILNPDSTMNLEAYHQYSPLFLSTTFAMTYGLSFASVTATLTHAFMYYRKQIWKQARRSLSEQSDIHARLMSRYPQVPDWWYAIIFLSMFTIGVISIELWPTQLPVWAFVLSLVIAFVYVIPVGMIQAITNQQVGLNVITELVIGYILPGRPVAMMMFKTWGYITMAQALQFTSDFKLGHYMKIPPRSMFWAQVAATMISATAQLGVQAWMFTNIDGMCDSNQKDGFICPNTQVFGTASILWGEQRLATSLAKPRSTYCYHLQVSSDQLFSFRRDRLTTLVYFFLIGAITPVITWFLAKKWPNSFWKYVNLYASDLQWNRINPSRHCKATAINYVPWAAVGFVSQYWIRRRYFAWWTKYNYVLAASLDAGAAIGIIVIFFCLQFPKNGTIGATNIQKWWGNTIPFTGADSGPTGGGTPVNALAPGETFGPSVW